MNQSQRFVVLDYETRSEVDLKTAGAYDYATHPSTEIICAAWKEEGEPTNSWCPMLDEQMPRAFISVIANPQVILVAHNAFFEQCITNLVLPRYLAPRPVVPIDRWECTAARSAALALPRSLEDACIALNLNVKKDMEGRRLVLKYCKPRKPTKNNPNKWHDNKNEIERLVKYCETDVEATLELFQKTVDLTDLEKKIWRLDQKINREGFKVDRELVDGALELIAKEEKHLLKECSDITGGAVRSPKQVAKTLEFLKIDEGIELPDLKAKTVADWLKSNPSNRLLEIRQALSKSSTAKYAAFKKRSEVDGYAKDNLLYHAASTGRWGGRGIQPQNFPRPTVKGVEHAIDLIKDRNLELVRLIYGSPMNVFSSLLRSVIIPTEGFTFYCGDYAAIEARVLFWIANHEKGLQAYKEERDLYREMAARIYGVKLKDVTPEQRDVGKRAILGCGYGMGAKKFEATCEQFGQAVSKTLAEKAVKAYRDTHYLIPRLWQHLEQAAVMAIKNPRKQIRINHTSWCYRNDFLWCELPSGRRLAYYKPSLKDTETPWGVKPTIHHYSVNSMTKKWENGSTYGGKLTENVVQAVARDLMAEAMLRVDESNFDVVLSVHDELLAEDDEAGRLEEFRNLMAETPKWAVGLPVKVDAWEGKRYRK